MSLQETELQKLKRAFPRAAHEFVNNFVYLTEAAIADRIEEIDPSWTFELLDKGRIADQAIVHARMTIKSISRDGIGMQKINEKAGEPEKGAATDALKRCARLFGIGRYLLDAPKEGGEFDKWLAYQQKEHSDQRPPPLVLNKSASPAPPNGASAEGDLAPDALDAEFGKREQPAVLWADAFAISWYDKQDGKGTYYLLHAADEHDSEIAIVAFDTTALTLLGFNLAEIKAKKTRKAGYNIRVPYTLETKDGKRYCNLDAEQVRLDHQYTGVPT